VTNVVIGAASGIGTAVAEKLAPRGPLLVVDRDLDGVKQVAGRIGGDIEAVACDIADPTQIDALAGNIDELDALVLTAGLSGASSAGRQIFEVNLMGTERILLAVEPLLETGSVAVCFASLSGHRIPERPELMAVLEDPLAADFFEKLGAAGVDADNSQLAYSVSKRGVMRLVRRRAKPWAARGARIMSLSPGSTDTPMSRFQEQQTPIQAEIIKNSPFGRRARPAEVASVVEFLTSAGASFMTGSDVLVDGGMAATVPDGGRPRRARPRRR
jgi:NAD(P)-dependent dehydrogenase (short-subunit alcohol dehydrogenase family)